MVSNPTRHPSDFGMDKISENFKEKSQIATNTVDVWSDEDEIGDNITSPVTSFKPIVTRTGKCLKIIEQVSIILVRCTYVGCFWDVQYWEMSVTINLNHYLEIEELCTRKFSKGLRSFTSTGGAS